MTNSHAGGGQGIRLVLGGSAEKYCVHDRVQYKEVPNEKVAAQLLLESSGIEYNPKLHKLHECACCHNLFWVPHTEPVYCNVCDKAPVFQIGGPLNEPKGVVA